jgi:hypothetical protein
MRSGRGAPDVGVGVLLRRQRIELGIQRTQRARRARRRRRLRPAVWLRRRGRLLCLLLLFFLLLLIICALALVARGARLRRCVQHSGDEVVLQVAFAALLARRASRAAAAVRVAARRGRRLRGGERGVKGLQLGVARQRRRRALVHLRAGSGRQRAGAGGRTARGARHAPRARGARAARRARRRFWRRRPFPAWRATQRRWRLRPRRRLWRGSAAGSRSRRPGSPAASASAHGRVSNAVHATAAAARNPLASSSCARRAPDSAGCGRIHAGKAA